MIDCEDNFAGQYMNAIRLYGKDNCIPVSAKFEITPLCNFSCPMCYVRRKNDEEVSGKMLNAEQWIDLAKQAKKMGVLNLTLTGGEIFTYDGFWKLYSELNKMGFLISLLSNGYLIDETAKANFKKYGTPYSVKLSLYGASNASYEKMCGVKDGFDRFSKAIDILKELKIPFSVTSTVIKENFDDLKAMYEFAAEKKFKFSHTFAVVSTRRTEQRNKYGRFFINNFAEGFSLEAFESMKHPVPKEPFDVCGSYKNSFWISWDGKIQNCSFSSEPAVSVKENKLKEAWRQLHEELAEIKFPAECGSCEAKEFCRVCPGVLNAETGSSERIIEKRCEEAKTLYSIYNKLKKEIE